MLLLKQKVVELDFDFLLVVSDVEILLLRLILPLFLLLFPLLVLPQLLLLEAVLDPVYYLVPLLAELFPEEVDEAAHRLGEDAQALFEVQAAWIILLLKKKK